MGQHAETDYRFIALAVGGGLVVANLGGFIWSGNRWALITAAALAVATITWVALEARAQITDKAVRALSRPLPRNQAAKGSTGPEVAERCSAAV